MSRIQRFGCFVFLVLLAMPAAADAATPSRGPVETVSAYVAALRAGETGRACALLAPDRRPKTAECRAGLKDLDSASIVRARIEPGALTRGARARVIVDLVQKERGRDPWTARARFLLRHEGGRWWIVETGSLPGISPTFVRRSPSDVGPSGTGAALRRLADDELLAVSGNELMLCDLLAPGAPLGTRDGGCFIAERFGAVDNLRYATRADRVTIHRTGPDRARLEVTLTVREAVRTKTKPGWAVRAHHTTDTLYAVRTSGRWRLAKLSRRAYLLLGVRPPDDVDAPGATATWPFADVPSISERPVPAECRRPPRVWAVRCQPVAGFAAGGGLVAWSWLGSAPALARPVAAGQAAGAVVDVSPSPVTAGRRLWVPEGVAPLPDGALVLERDLTGDGTLRAVPVGPDGRPRGAAQVVGQLDDQQDVAPRVIPGPPGSSTATVLLDWEHMVRLDADGRRVGTAAMGIGQDSIARLLARADGTLLELTDGQGLEVRARGADGAPSGTVAQQAPLRPGYGIAALAGAQAVDGRVLVVWIETDDRGRGVVRAWAFDPSAPTATAPMTVVAIPQVGATDALVQSNGETLAAVALPGGGWGVAWRWLPKTGGTELWASRLDAVGAPAVAARRVTQRLTDTALGRAGFGLAGDTVAFIEWPEIAGLPQVRAAPLP
ncbi:MAG: hypothetical protein ABW167_18935 [Baekduia sp.]